MVGGDGEHAGGSLAAEEMKGVAAAEEGRGGLRGCGDEGLGQTTRTGKGRDEDGTRSGRGENGDEVLGGGGDRGLAGPTGRCHGAL